MKQWTYSGRKTATAPKGTVRQCGDEIQIWDGRGRYWKSQYQPIQSPQLSWAEQVDALNKAKAKELDNAFNNALRKEQKRN